MEWKAWAINVEQMARVGEPAPRAIIRRLNRTGTGGVGSKYRTRSKMFFRSYVNPIRFYTFAGQPHGTANPTMRLPIF